MSSNTSVFLETHNIKNRATGFGVFNYELIKGFAQLPLDNFDLYINSSTPRLFRAEFGKKFKYQKYIGAHRYKNFRTYRKYDLWHSVNQNTRIEPRFDTTYLLTVHDVNFVEEVSNDMNHKINIAFKEKLKRATAITYISEFARKQTRQYFDVPPIPEFIIYNGNPISTILDTSAVVPKMRSHQPFLFSIGDFRERKNFQTIVEMMRTLPDFDLIIAGNSSNPYGQGIKQYIADHQLEQRVFLIGKISELEKQYYLQHCTAFLFPSVLEGFGLPPIEAMTFGKPVFLANSTSLPEIGGDAAYYWEHFEPEYMREVLFQGLDNFYANQLQCEAKLMQRANSFNWVDTAAQYFALYKKCLEQ